MMMGGQMKIKKIRIGEDKLENRMSTYAEPRLDSKKVPEVNFKNLARDLLDNNIKQFAFLFSSDKEDLNQRRVERVYSKNEIRDMVTKNLIAEYHHEQIIDAVTDYLYSMHMMN